MLKKIFKKKNTNIRDTVINNLSDMVDRYDKWYEEFGLYLPPDYECDPTGWTEALHSINKAFKLLRENEDNKFSKEQEEDIKSGLFLFGKYLYWLNDEIK